MTTSSEIIKKYVPAGANAEINGRTILFEVSHEALSAACVMLSETHKLPLKTMFASDDRTKDKSFKIFYVFGVPKENYFIVPYITLADTTTFPSLTAVLYPASLYESHIHEMFGLIPEGYPGLLQPNILHDNFPAHVHPMRKDFTIAQINDSKNKEHLTYKFFEVQGEGIYEVPVGPVHAGIIEPGHFRFSMAGEIIVNLEAKLGWMHKGSEKLFETLPLEKKLLLSERIAGDTSFAHSTAFMEAIEELAELEVPKRAKYLRVVYGELERLANHFNDIGFILSDTGFNFGLANGTRLRERIMQLNEKLTGSRFLRGVNTFGGVTHDIDIKTAEGMHGELILLEKDFTGLIEIAGGMSVIQNRLEGTGRLTNAVAKDHDAVGVPARASGMAVDARADYPYAAYAEFPIDVAVETTGDVRARYSVRVKEVYSSIALIREALTKIPAGEVSAKGPLTLKKNAYAIGIAEGWRGDVVYVVATDANGEISRVAVRDASFINWNLIPHCAPGNVLLDFPLINKSFNLSYTGYDR
jgi:Ni,Fe-hydrogenase III large subunit/Ni,Fe-hydrogenase III component G